MLKKREGEHASMENNGGNRKGSVVGAVFRLILALLLFALGGYILYCGLIK